MRIFIPASPAGYFEKYFAGGKKSFRSLTRRSSLKEFEFSFQYPEPMKNLLRETLEALAKNGKNVADVEWVGFLQTLFSGWDWPAAYMDWADFERLADQYDYEDGYCYSGLPLNLAVVGKDWWLERKEYDGQEEWVFKQYPPKPLKKISPDSLRTKEEE